MTSPTPLPTDVTPVDPDIAGQAVPGHGVPSQDPDKHWQRVLRSEPDMQAKPANP